MSSRPRMISTRDPKTRSTGFTAIELEKKILSRLSLKKISLQSLHKDGILNMPPCNATPVDICEEVD